MAPETIQILGSKVNSFVSYEAFYAHVNNLLNGHTSKGYVTVNNVHTMMEAYRKPSYQTIINESLLSIPDGKPLSVVGRLKGNRGMTRLFGPTVMEKFIDWGRADGYRHFLFGSDPKTLAKLHAEIEQRFPGAQIVGMISPPYAPAEQWNNEAFINSINQAKPDFIWVGLGAPKQEQWMYANWKKLDSGLLFGIGAGFDYLAGNTKHAPGWMKNASLEWLFRLAQEPRRLWKRYATTIPPFIFLSIIELIGLKINRRQTK